MTWLIDPDHDDAMGFARELFANGEKGHGGSLIRLGIARKEKIQDWWQRQMIVFG